MTRRRTGWDYCAPGVYMITLTLADRSRGWLGEITAEQARGHHDGLAAGGHHDGLVVGWHSACELARKSISLTPLGHLVADKWREIADNWPGVVVGEFIIMPDHLHGILKITCRQRHPLGQIVGSFKARSTSAARGSSLWSPGLVDSILWSDERYCRALAYIADNPRRLAAKRANPRLFAVRRDLAVRLPLGDNGTDITAYFSAVGNDNLLGRLDVHQVQCSRRFFAYAKDKWGKPLKDQPPACETAEFKAIADAALAAAADGAVLVNPCVSQGEREIARRAFEKGAAMVVLRNKGFSPLFKPEGSLFDRCVEGKLLMLAPAAWPYVPGNKPMSREDACALNRIAQAIARDGAAEIDYKGRTPSFVNKSAMDAVRYDFSNQT